MEIQNVSKELLSDVVMYNILNDWSNTPPTPVRAKQTLIFGTSSFYDLYSNHWDSFVELRKDVRIALSDPAHLKLENNEVVFNLSSNEVSPESLGILKVYLEQSGWESFTVGCTGYVNFVWQGTFSNKTCYEFRLTNK